MALYPPWSNTAFRIVLVAMALTPAVIIGGLMLYMRSPFNTGELLRVDQPVEFDHRHHVLDNEIDCLYCHSGAETSAVAGVPATEVCMGCHAQIWSQSPLLETVRRSYFSGEPIPWNRVHNLPDFSYFNHAVHTQRGVGCVECHGRVDQMPRVEKMASLQMSWCLDCHRQAESRYLGAKPERREPYNSLWGATFPASAQRDAKTVYDVTALTTCTACHR